MYDHGDNNEDATSHTATNEGVKVAVAEEEDDDVAETVADFFAI